MTEWQHVAVVLREHPLILVLYDRRSDRGLLDTGEAELFERRAHRRDSDAVVVRDEGRREADPDGGSGSEENLRLFGLVDDLLRVLRTYDEALSAEYALVPDDVRLVRGEPYRLHRTVADTFIAVLAV